jgi:phenylpropionate dioxygenase-like ring-hydroxylating dioxygenase large terminal subunit
VARWRGGALADGRIRGDCIECPDHGWQFTGDGSGTRIPSLGPDAKIPGRRRIDAYPVVEKYGLNHVFLGDLPESERPPIMEVAQYGDPAWRPIFLELDWKIDYKRSVENTKDPAHNEFTHSTHGFLGVRNDYFVPDIEVMERPWGVGFMNKYHAAPLADQTMHAATGRSGAAYVDAGAGSHGPNCTWTYIHPADRTWMHGYMLNTPVHEGLDRIRLLFPRNFLLDAKYDQTFIDRSVFIAEQDRCVLEPISPSYTPPNNAHEFMVPADAVIARYRDLCRQWEKQGWRIDVRRLQADRGFVSYAVPSRSRCAGHGWVLQSVPLMQPQDSRVHG